MVRQGEAPAKANMSHINRGQAPQLIYPGGKAMALVTDVDETLGPQLGMMAHI